MREGPLFRLSAGWRGFGKAFLFRKAFERPQKSSRSSMRDIHVIRRLHGAVDRFRIAMFGLLRKRGISQLSGDALRLPVAVKVFMPRHEMHKWFARFLALVWLMKGLAAWATIFGVLGTGNGFLLRHVDFQAAVVFFAVFDVIAAVGLWMLSAWGGVVWLIAVLGYIGIAAANDELVPFGHGISWLFGIFAVVYFLLAWLAAREPLS